MRRRERECGLTLVEIVIATALLAAVLASAVKLLDASNDLARSMSDERAAAMRIDRALGSISDEFRRGSLATITHLDGTPFTDGDTGTGFRLQPIDGWNGGPVLGTELRYEFSLPIGAAEGELVRREGVVETILARGITSFAVTRTANSFDFAVTAGAGPANDRRRLARGSIRVMARNP